MSLEGCLLRVSAAHLERVGPERLEKIVARLMSDRRLWANDELAVAAHSEASDPEDKSSYLSELCEHVLPTPDGVLERYGFAIPS